MRLLYAAAAAFLLPGLARADFVIQPAPTPPAPGILAKVARPRAARPLRPAVPVAEGFGKDVPLRVAVEQILPANFQAHYGQGVDPEQVVDWAGGRPWPDVLRTLVQPLHLRATVAASAVKIDAVPD